MFAHGILLARRTRVRAAPLVPPQVHTIPVELAYLLLTMIFGAKVSNTDVAVLDAASSTATSVLEEQNDLKMYEYVPNDKRGRAYSQRHPA